MRAAGAAAEESYGQSQLASVTRPLRPTTVPRRHRRRSDRPAARCPHAPRVRGPPGRPASASSARPAWCAVLELRRRAAGDVGQRPRADDDDAGVAPGVRARAGDRGREVVDHVAGARAGDRRGAGRVLRGSVRRVRGTSGQRQASSQRTPSSSCRATGARSSPRPRTGGSRRRRLHARRRARPVGPGAVHRRAAVAEPHLLPAETISMAYRSTPRSRPAPAPSSTRATGRSGRSARGRREPDRDVHGAVDLVRLRALGGDAFDHLVAVLQHSPVRRPGITRRNRILADDTRIPLRRSRFRSAGRARERPRNQDRSRLTRSGGEQQPGRLVVVRRAHDTAPHRAGARHTRRRTQRNASGSGTVDAIARRGARRSSASRAAR